MRTLSQGKNIPLGHEDSATESESTTESGSDVDSSKGKNTINSLDTWSFCTYFDHVFLLNRIPRPLKETGKAKEEK